MSKTSRQVSQKLNELSDAAELLKVDVAEVKLAIETEKLAKDKITLERQKLQTEIEAIKLKGDEEIVKQTNYALEKAQMLSAIAFNETAKTKNDLSASDVRLRMALESTKATLVTEHLQMQEAIDTANALLAEFEFKYGVTPSLPE